MIFPESPPREVTDAYALSGVLWKPLGAGGGFSGAKIWRGETGDGLALCLKGHPPGRIDWSILSGNIHRWMRAARLGIVPRIRTTRNGHSTVPTERWDMGVCWVWELIDWMPGRADFHSDPTDRRLAAAVDAIAKLHRNWAKRESSVQPAPAIARRLHALTDWERTVAIGWRPQFAMADGPLREPAELAWNILPSRVRQAIRDLEPWGSVPVAVQPCLCDVWHDHVLFDGDRVTGIIDFAAMKIDHPAVDLARLLGSLIPDDPLRTAFALDVYQQTNSLSHPQLIDLLDWTGTVVAATHWLRRVYLEPGPRPDLTAVAHRLAAIVQRLVRRG
jgi:Ser/Thr protein kinase RdoA (MazF antagonist)